MSSTEADWGFETPGELDRLVVISPHLDDAVISCGALLLAHPGATVITMFAASPSAYTVPLNEWDTECGFVPGDDTMAVRRDEDGRALAAVGAAPVWLEFCQHSHEPRDDPTAVPPGALDALSEAVVRLDPSTIVAPLGLAHPDHQSCHATALAASDAVPSARRLWYSDLPYVYIPGVQAARFRMLHRAGLVATPACPSVSSDADAKWRAFCEYGTQVAGLDAQWRLRDRLTRGGERYWMLL